MANVDLLAQLSEPSSAKTPIIAKEKPRNKSRVAYMVALSGIIAASAFAYTVVDAKSSPSESLQVVANAETKEVILPTNTAESLLDDTVLNASGYVIATREATVAANATGRIVKVNFEVGDFIKKGDVIAEMDDEALKLQEAQANSQLSGMRLNLEAVKEKYQQQKVELKRQQHLFDRNMVSEAVLTKLQHEVALSKIELAKTKQDIISSEWALKIVQQRIADTKIKAPFSGVATHIAAREGEIVSPLSGGAYTRSGICTLIDRESLAIEVDVNESYLSKISIGQNVKIKLSSSPENHYAGTVDKIVPTADKKTAAIKVRVVLDQIVPEILPQMTAQVDFKQLHVSAASFKQPEALGGTHVK